MFSLESELDIKIKPEGLVTDDSLYLIHWVKVKTIVVANKADLPTSVDNFKILEEFYEDRFQLISVSALNQTNLDSIRFSIIETLELLRVYSKRPGHNA